MAKTKSWINLLKKLFISEAKANPVKKEKRRRWILGRFKWKRLPILAAPLPVKERKLSEAEKEHSKHALTVAIVTAVAAKAAVASAQAAAEVVRLTGTPRLYIQTKRESRDLAATKIQTAFRGYLAKKALRALKGLVRLQAIVRGQAVRRQVITTLRGLQTLVKIQSKVCATRDCGDKHLITQSNELRKWETRVLGQPELNCRRGWDDNLPSKKETDALFLSRQESLIKKERIKEYILRHQEGRNSKQSIESEADKVNERLTDWLEQWVDTQELKTKRQGNPDIIAVTKSVQRNVQGEIGVKLRDLRKHELLAGRNSSVSPPRRSFDKLRRNLFEDNDSLGSPAVPNYMSPTESAKARLRSISMPKQILGLQDTYSDHGSPSKNRPSFSSIRTDPTSIGKSGKAHSSHERSLSLKGLLGPINSYQTAKDLSLDSESSLLNWV